jgi:hypothetical protein
LDWRLSRALFVRSAAKFTAAKASYLPEFPELLAHIAALSNNAGQLKINIHAQPKLFTCSSCEEDTT